MRCSYLLLAAVLLVLPSWTRRADADALVVTKAMTASTIAEIFVEEASIRVELEIGLADVRAFQNALPDEQYERLGNAPRPLAERQRVFLDEDWVVLADGKPLATATLALEGGRRVPRDEITGEPLKVPEAEQEPVLRLELLYTIESKPRTLTIRPPRNELGVAAAIGFITYHRGLPVMEFRYLAQEATLDLDWDDPWYSKFRHRNLQRRYAAPMSVYLYVEPFEVRQEVILRPRDLQHWVDLGLEGRETIRADEQEALKQKIVAFLEQHNPLTIDGEVVERRFDRANFVRRTLRMTGVIDPPEDLDLVSATLGVIFHVPRSALPQKVSTRWELWSPRIQKVPASASDEAGGLPWTLTPEDPVLEWINFLKHPSAFAMAEVAPPKPPARWALPLASLLIALLGLGLVWRTRRTSPRRALGYGAVAGLAVVLLWPYLRVDLPNPLAGAEDWNAAEADTIVAGLLHNVYRSFDRREDDVVYDRLARSIAGERLQTAFLEIRKRMELENQGGARVKVTGVQLLESRTHPLEGQDGFAGTCTWNVSGSVGHWGHVHQRTNQYRADIRVVPVAGAWKITVLDVTGETRLAALPTR